MCLKLGAGRVESSLGSGQIGLDRAYFAVHALHTGGGRLSLGSYVGDSGINLAQLRHSFLLFGFQHLRLLVGITDGLTLGLARGCRELFRFGIQIFAEIFQVLALGCGRDRGRFLNGVDLGLNNLPAFCGLGAQVVHLKQQESIRRQ